MAYILAVDDEPGILDMIQSILMKDGHHVTCIADPKKVAHTKINSYDLI